MAKLITNFILWALFLGACGGLVDVVRATRDKAIQAHKLGLVSLGKLSRALNR